jgi:hypothetical protein
MPDQQFTKRAAEYDRHRHAITLAPLPNLVSEEKAGIIAVLQTRKERVQIHGSIRLYDSAQGGT